MKARPDNARKGPQPYQHPKSALPQRRGPKPKHGPRIHGVPDSAPMPFALPLPPADSPARRRSPSFATDEGMRKHLDRLVRRVNERDLQQARKAAAKAEHPDGVPPEQDEHGRPLLGRLDGKRVQPPA